MTKKYIIFMTTKNIIFTPKTCWCGQLEQVPQPWLASLHWLVHLPCQASPVTLLLYQKYQGRAVARVRREGRPPRAQFWEGRKNRKKKVFSWFLNWIKLQKWSQINWKSWSGFFVRKTTTDMQGCCSTFNKTCFKPVVCQPIDKPKLELMCVLLDLGEA